MKERRFETSGIQGRVVFIPVGPTQLEINIVRADRYHSIQQHGMMDLDLNLAASDLTFPFIEFPYQPGERKSSPDPSDEWRLTHGSSDWCTRLPALQHRSCCIFVFEALLLDVNAWSPFV